jgi:hypothetical protein
MTKEFNITLVSSSRQQAARLTIDNAGIAISDAKSQDVIAHISFSHIHRVSRAHDDAAQRKLAIAVHTTKGLQDLTIACGSPAAVRSSHTAPSM